MSDNKGKRNDIPGWVLPLVIGLSALAVIMAIGVATFFILTTVNRSRNDNAVVEEGPKEEAPDEDEEEEETVEDKDRKKASGADKSVGEIKSLDHASFLDGEAASYSDSSLVPSVPSYEIEPDLSNIYNQRDIDYLGDNLKRKLARNGFAVNDGGSFEFYDVYESNRYAQSPNFVTVDSMMHTYHVYFAHILKTLEKNELYDKLTGLSQEMYDRSMRQYEELEGTEWEEAALRNVAFFTIGRELLDDSPKVLPEAKDTVDEELKLIDDAQGVSGSPLFMSDEDYSQYKPRGYYADDEILSKYFRAMMWYGRRAFKQDDEDHMRSALLMTLAMDDAALEEWEGIYTVTAFFAGASDDCTYYEFRPMIEAAYGNLSYLDELVDNEDAFDTFYELTKEMKAPQINSIPVFAADEKNVIPSFRFMGQRFSLDAMIFQNLIYRQVEENPDGDNRMLPDALDVPAALGSETAYNILNQQGDTDYKGYEENLDKLKDGIEECEDTELWTASLYAQWLNTLRPILNEKGKGYPSFMQSEEWNKKSLECFLGSYSELKHDTILYSKQAMAEMGGGWEEDVDDRGYVEPEPEVYSRFAILAENTMEGLKKYDLLDKNDKQNLTILAEIAKKLVVISEKELRNETLTEEEYDYIREFGGDLEHVWSDGVKEEDEDYASAELHPGAIVADVATDPNGTVLELGTGRVSEMFVVCPVAGRLKVCSGPVYSFYQFKWPIDDRLTDKEWRVMLGIWPKTEGEYDFEPDQNLKQPTWTDSYRVKNDR
ncbi:MAG: DUF3160 domain-containing protein [Lachnospiraceae bacterium]|nr:DUF3160 domain-containing protein [Lachnospiraceae bacterium]